MKSELEMRWKAFAVFCTENKKITLLVLAAVGLILALQTVSFLNRTDCYITDKAGRVTAIIRGYDDETLSVPLRVKAVKGSMKTELELILSLSRKNEKKTGEKKKVDEETRLSSEIENLAKELELSEEMRISLPSLLEDGTQIMWYQDKTRPSFEALLLFPLTMLLLYRDSLQKKRSKEKRELDSVRRSLPAFNNQLLLLLGSGLIFYDAFSRIADGYERRQGKNSYFNEMIVDVMRQSDLAGNSLVTMLDGCAKRLSVKEFSRITNIIMDNQYKGVNLTEKLESESDILWSQRKKSAEEKGRLAETRLTFPLALLLLVLIMVTAAPAIMEM